MPKILNAFRVKVLTMESCLSIIIQHNRFYFRSSEYGALLLVSRAVLEIVKMYLAPLNMSALDMHVFNAICEFGFDHILARVASPEVAIRFTKLFGFMACKQRIESGDLAECVHINTRTDENGNIILLDNVCSLDDRVIINRAYTTTNPIMNAICMMNVKAFKRIVKVSKCDLSYVHVNTGCNRALEIAIVANNTEVVRSLVRMGITSNNMGFLIINCIMFGMVNLDDAYEMIHALLCRTTYADFTSFRFRDMEYVFHRILNVVHFIALLECGLDLDYLEDTRGVITRYLANVLFTVTTEDHPPLYLKNWLDITTIIAGSMHGEGRDELYLLVNDIETNIKQRLPEAAE